ncbi:MAG: tetratricopeptide repeat protein [Defluviitaleaceae bacterium]|nr:tetratricopeptide repeat protein [Defluviitaleaceae bacterium]
MGGLSPGTGLSKLSVGEKILKLRKYNKVSQLELVEIMRVRVDRITRAEQGEDTYTAAHIAAAKERFGIVGLPLTERECIAFRERLYIVRDLIRARKLDEAKDIQKEMAHIDRLEPCDFDMAMLCKLIEVQLFKAEGDCATVEKKLDAYQKHLKKMNDECLYHYNYCRGALLGHQGHYKEALDYFLVAYELTENNKNLLPEDDERLYYYIAWCYSNIEIPHLAIFFMMKAKQTHTDNRITDFSLNIDRGLALNYIKMNQLKDAERLLNKCMTKAESLFNDTYIGVTFLFLGLAHKKAKKWASAIENFDKALGYLPENTDNHYSALYHKVLCTIQARTFVKAREHLDYVKTLGCLDKKWVINFTALGHYYTIKHKMTSYKNYESIAYIEDVAIPHFIEEHDYFLAIEYYTLLEQHFEKVKSEMRSLSAAKAIKDIFMRCFINHGGDD